MKVLCSRCPLQGEEPGGCVKLSGCNLILLTRTCVDGKRICGRMTGKSEAHRNQADFPTQIRSVPT